MRSRVTRLFSSGIGIKLLTQYPNNQSGAKMNAELLLLDMLCRIQFDTSSGCWIWPEVMTLTHATDLMRHMHAGDWDADAWEWGSTCPTSGCVRADHSKLLTPEILAAA